MNCRIKYVEATFGFMFEHGFAHKFEQLGSPSNDLDFWYRNALVYQTVTAARPIPDLLRTSLLTLIEAIRFDAMCGSLFGEPLDFDLSAYEFSEKILSYKDQVAEQIRSQEAVSPSSIGPSKTSDQPSTGASTH